MANAKSSYALMIIATLAAGQMSGCAPYPANSGSGRGSSTKNILEQDFAEWQAPTARIQAVQQMMQARGNNVLQNMAGNEQMFINAMAKVPPATMAWLIQQPNFTITFEGGGSGGASGMCMLGSPESVSITVQGDQRLLPSVLLHELGHATQQWVTSTTGFGGGGLFPEPDTQWQNMADAASNNGMFSRYARSYKDQNQIETFYTETWAEAFDGYYFSQESNQRVAAVFPEIHAYIRAKMAPPAWEMANSGPIDNTGTGIGTGTGTGTGNTPLWNQSGITVAIPEQAVLTRINASGPETLASMALCLGTLIECSSGLAASRTFKGAPVQGSVGRKTFSFTIPPVPNGQKVIPMAFIGYAMDSQPAKSRQVILTHK